MIAPNRLNTRVLDAGVLALSGAAPQTAAGKTLNPRAASEGTLSLFVKWKITTNTLTYTLKWQVSMDASTWDDVHPSNNAAIVVLATGTGSGVTAQKVVDAPAAVYGYNYARAIVVTGTASGGGAGVDEIQALSYSFRKPFNGN